MDCLYIVIPAYNEEETIEPVARAWHEVVERVGGGSKLLILDDGSKDATGDKLRALCAELPRLEPVSKPNSGHGGTVRYGYQAALERGADYVFQTDSDGQTLPEEIWPMWERRADFDAQVGWRTGRQDGLSRVLVSKALRVVILFFFGCWPKDANTPFRLMSAASLSRRLPKVPEDYNLTNVLLTVLYHRDGARIRYVPITFLPRQGGVNSINLRRIFRIGRRALKDFATLRGSMR